MKLGPFNIRDVDSLVELFEKKNISFKLDFDKNLERQILERYHQSATPAPRATAGTLDLSTAFFEIKDQDVDKVKDDLEKYGVLGSSDGSYELGEED